MSLDILPSISSATSVPRLISLVSTHYCACHGQVSVRHGVGGVGGVHQMVRVPSPDVRTMAVTGHQRRAMLRACATRVSGSTRMWTAALLCTLLLLPTTARGQGSTTATIRGTIQDSSGGVLPGATITVTNQGTKGVQSTVSDDRGQYLVPGLFP